MALRLGGALKELRIHLCQKSKGSEGVREFIKQRYVELKKANPNFPILVRECSGIEAVIWARYDRGSERSIRAENLGSSDVLNAVQQLVNQK